MVVGPAVLQPSQPGDVVGIKLVGTGAMPAGQAVTFGQAFEKGLLNGSQGLMARIGDQLVRVQMDVKATWGDGSVRDAILTLATPGLTAGQSADAMLTIGSPDRSPPITAQAVLDRGVGVTADFNVQGRGTVHLDVNSLLHQAIAAGTVDTYLSGSQVSEFRVRSTVVDGLSATFDIRAYADGRTRTDVIVGNNDGFNPATQDETYTVALTQNGSTVYSADLTQAKFTDWHQQVWSNGAAPAIQVNEDMAALERSGAIPNYDLGTGVAATGLDGLGTALQSYKFGPEQAGSITPYMPETGGRPDIGIVPTYGVQTIETQDPRARALLLANADQAGSVPWHVDNPNGTPVTLDQHPGMVLSSDASPASAADALPNGFSIAANGFTIDNAHQPALSYLPYLLTGDRWNLDQLENQANWVMAKIDPNYRGGAQGLVGFQPMRDQAWSLRTLSDAAFILPDADPLKAYFTAKLQNNLDNYVKTYITDRSMSAAGQLEGYVQDHFNNHTDIPPWQNDYVVQVFGELASRGSTQAAQMLNWMTNFTAGRFLAPGAQPTLGAPYTLANQDPQTDHLIGTWAEAFTKQFGSGAAPSTLNGRPNLPNDYAAVARAALASIITGTGNPQAVEAFGWVADQMQVGASAFASDPSFDIVPRLANGQLLHNADMQFADQGDHVLTAAADRPALLWGGSGNDTLVGGNQGNFLYAHGAADLLQGGSGSDYLFAGSGADTLVGGGGTDYLKLGAGPDTVVIDPSQAGTMHIDGFDPTRDRFHIVGGGLTAATLLASATADSAGDVVLHMAASTGPQVDVTLAGVSRTQLNLSPLIVG